MINPEKINEIEAKLASAGKTVADLCREAEIAQTTWGRWKRGAFYPSYKKSEEVMKAFAKLTESDQSA